MSSTLLLTGVGGAVAAGGGAGVAFVNSTEQTTSENYSHTTSGSDRLLIVSIDQQASGDVTAVTYNGVSMTKITNIGVAVWSGSLWYLINPASGSNTVDITSTFGTIHSSSSTWSGVHQTTAWSGLVSDSKTGANSNNLSVTIVTVATDGSTFEVVLAEAGAYNPASGQTEISDQDDGSEHLSTGYEIGTGANMTQEWTRPFFYSAILKGIRLNPV